MPTGDHLRGEGGDKIREVAAEVQQRRLEVAREPHEQAFKRAPLEAPPEFAGAQFIAFLLDLKLPKQGDAVLQLQVPARYVDFALPVRHGRGQPLSIDVQLWENYNAARRGEPLPLDATDLTGLDGAALTPAREGDGPG